MSETDWLAGAVHPRTMLEWSKRLSRHQGAAQNRKYRLLAVALARRKHDGNPVGDAELELVERYADGLASQAEFRAAQDREPRLHLGQPVYRPAGYNFDLLWHEAYFSAAGLLSGVAEQVEAERIREVFGNPFRPVTFSAEWRTDTAVSLARTMYGSRDFSAMPILADAIQDAGCDNEDVLDHCRDAALTHVRGCWVVDLVLGKA